jgi:hypothetical protein
MSFRMVNPMEITIIVRTRIILAMVITIPTRVPRTGMTILVDAIFVTIAIAEQRSYDVYDILNISEAIRDRSFSKERSLFDKLVSL